MRIDEKNGTRVLVLAADGPVVSTADDAADLVGGAWARSATVVAIPVERLDPAFFDLSSGVAGELTRTLENYRLRLAVVGDIAEHVDASTALRDFVWESNRGAQVWFVPDEASLAAKLG
ncbi:DUF4180 domain-containing protein [Agromyces sp. NPDC058064]|uniref:DUF4180 domain-containing protein n=1 Tax=Agromyces sp. NPDC058064 TaxID=3346322 RepID=UPI0036DF3B92